MSIVIKTLTHSDEDVIIKEIQPSCQHAIETLKYDDGITTNFSLYIFTLKNAPLAKALLMKCVEHEEFDIEHIDIETRYSKVVLDKIT